MASSYIPATVAADKTTFAVLTFILLGVSFHAIPDHVFGPTEKHLLWHINDVLHKCEKISRLHGFHYLESPPCHFLLVRTALRRAYTPARRSKQTAQANRKGLLRLLRADDPLSLSCLYVLMVLFLRAGQPARASSECFALEVH